MLVFLQALPFSLRVNLHRFCLTRLLPSKENLCYVITFCPFIEFLLRFHRDVAMSLLGRSFARVCPQQRQLRSSALTLTRSQPRLALGLISLKRTCSLNPSRTLGYAALARQSFSTSSSLSSSPIVCPECAAEASSDSRYSFFCSECLSILPVDRTKSYFQVLNTPATYDVDPRALVIYKRHLMKQLHPDKFVREEPEVMKMAEDQSALSMEDGGWQLRGGEGRE